MFQIPFVLNIGLGKQLFWNRAFYARQKIKKSFLFLKRLILIFRIKKVQQPFASISFFG